MKIVFKIIAAYIVIQLSVTFLVVAPFTLLFPEKENTHFVLLSMLISNILTLIYLWKAGYIGAKRYIWSPVPVRCLLLSVLIIFPVIFLLDYLLSYFAWLPDIMKQEFDLIQSNWFGIVLITILGPVFEEILFRGTITKILLNHYSPAKALLISALIFGVIHINPVQVFGAGLIGLLLAWIYYKTASLLPCLIIHIINNSTSVFLGKIYPDANYLKDIMSEEVSNVLLVLSLILLTGACWKWSKQRSPVNWFV
jgi:membrane protease YdiL (CAAX protease family)